MRPSALTTADGAAPFVAALSSDGDAFALAAPDGRIKTFDTGEARESPSPLQPL